MSGANPDRPAVLDATVFSNFAYLDEVHRLQVLPRPVAPEAVRRELLAGAETYPILANG